MNFLSHFYLDEENDNPDYLFGLILPDLIRIFDSKLRVKNPITKGNINIIDRGVIKHYTVDAVFHNSKLFKESTKIIQECLKLSGYTIKKGVYFTAHIIIELLLDRLLLKEKPYLGHIFYSRLLNVDKHRASMYLNTILSVEKSMEFFTFFNGFINKRFIFNYLDNNNFCLAVSNIVFKVTWQKHNKTDLKALEECLIIMEEKYRLDVNNIFNDLKLQISK